jgi:hypothetical protein
MKRGKIIVFAATIGLAAGLFSAAAPAAATVGSAAASWTPSITSTNSTVRQLVQCGSTVYAVGSFSTVAQGGTSYPRNNAFSFSATTGALTGWNPNPNGVVNSVALSGDCATAYLGGAFSAIGSTKVADLAAVSTSTSAVNAAFGHTTNGAVNTVALVNSGHELLVGGNFTTINGTARGYYASVSPTSGAVDSYLTAAVAGRLPANSGPTKVYNQQLSPRGDRLLFEGIFTSVGGVGHLQIAELDLSSTAATLDPWSNATLNSTYCSTSEQFYARDAAFSPDQGTIYIATTGYQGSSPYCDAVTAFANTASAPVKWINKTGGDSLYAVAAGPSDVYIGGHERWANNPNGSDSCGTGCVSRPGIGDVSATSGLATTWNPTRSRGQGADDLLITSAGLWVASDTFDTAVNCAGKYHPGICFFPGAA